MKQPSQNVSPILRGVLASLALVVVTTTWAQSIPSADVLLRSWKSNIESLSSLKSYELNGTAVNTSILDEGKKDRGKWRIFQDEKKLRWEFHFPVTDTHMVAFDGSKWRLITDVRSSPKIRVSGSILVDPVKDLGTDALTPYREGMAGVYPLTADQLVANPYQAKTSTTMVDELLRRVSRLKVTAHKLTDGKTCYKMMLPPDASSKAATLPQVVTFESIQGRFLPISFSSRTKIGEVDPMTTSCEFEEYQMQASVLIPSRMSIVSIAHSSKGQDVVVGKRTMVFKFSNINQRIDASEFTFEFPRGAVVFNQEAGRGIPIEIATDSPVTAGPFQYLVGNLGVITVVVFTVLAIVIKLRRKAPKI